jgi:hypothetical protein
MRLADVQTGVDQGRDEPLGRGDTGDVVTVDLEDDSVANRSGKLSLTRGRDDVVARGDDDGGRHVDLMHPGMRREAGNGRSRLQDGGRVVSGKFPRHPGTCIGPIDLEQQAAEHLAMNDCRHQSRHTGSGVQQRTRRQIDLRRREVPRRRT